MKTKYEQGYTHDELIKLCEEWNINFNDFCEELGVNTGIVIDSEFITYTHDVNSALHRCLTGEKQHPLVWD